MKTQTTDTLDKLSKLAIKYGTDKWSRKHHYTPVYYKLFNKQRKSFKKVLEIGIGEGPSLRMWRDFFPNAKIYGAEIQDNRIFEDGAIKVYKCDQSSLKDLKALIKEIGTDIDFIVEDGSHIPEHQVFTCLTLMPLLKKEAVYIIEDVADPSIFEQLSAKYDCEILTVGNRYDDRLIIVKNKPASASAKKKSGISIFAPPVFLNTAPGQEFVFDGTKPKGYLKRVSSLIRKQLADALNAKFNPKKGYENDICIYIKPNLDSNRDFKFEGKSSYLDIADELFYTEVLRKHPEVTAIVSSERDYISLATEGIPNKIVLLPQHHCNFERAVRTRKGIKTAGVIGNSKAFRYLPPELKTRLEERGIKLIAFSEFFRREDIVDFYKKIDIQIVWRPWRKKLANPQKIINAASFGIPTIALDESYFDEAGNCYIGVNDLNHFFKELDLLIKHPARYEAFSKLCLKKAEEYHIDKIVSMYQELQ